MLFGISALQVQNCPTACLCLYHVSTTTVPNENVLVLMCVTSQNDSVIVCISSTVIFVNKNSNLFTLSIACAEVLTSVSRAETTLTFRASNLIKYTKQFTQHEQLSEHIRVAWGKALLNYVSFSAAAIAAGSALTTTPLGLLLVNTLPAPLADALPMCGVWVIILAVCGLVCVPCALCTLCTLCTLLWPLCSTIS